MIILYVDDEPAALRKFDALAEKLQNVTRSVSFQDECSALDYMRKNPVDLVFLDIEMPGLNGFELAGKMKAVSPLISLVFVTAHDRYALDAFGVDALGYLMKPYSLSLLQHAVDRAACIRPISQSGIYLKTMPYFDVFVNNRPLFIRSAKVKEMLALLTDLDGSELTVGYAIACLWENRPNDEAGGSLFRVTYKHLRDFLAEEGISSLLTSGTARHSLDTGQYTSDYRSFMLGDEKIKKDFDGRYMAQYSWAEETASRLQRIAGML